MKSKRFLPLIMFLGLTVSYTIFRIPRNIFMILGFSMFLYCFIITYISGMNETAKNIDAVIKIHEKTPILIPLSFFVIPNLIFVFLNLGNFSLFIQYGLCIIACMITYFSGIAIVIRDLKPNQASISLNSGKVKDKKLLLINPVNPHQSGLTVNKSSMFPPLGLGIIAALSPDDFEVQLIDENIEPFHFETADLVGITAFTSSANWAYQIAEIYRERNIPVVMGGIHASMLPDEALQYVDSVVIGEAESIWEEVIRDFNQGKLKKIYRGELSELTNTVVPRRELFSDQYLFATVQTSRGCPMDCYFCSVTPFNGKKYRQRPYEEVLDELEKIPQKMIFFVDDNILGYGKEAEQRAIELFKGMVNRGLNKSWFCQASLNFGDNEEVLKWAAKSGCKMVFLGLESADPVELKEMHKNLNLKLEYDWAFQKIHKYGIVVLGAFIFGSDTETQESIDRKTGYILKSPIDVVQTTILTPLPGTRLFEQYQREGRLDFTDFPTDWDHYNMTELTYKMNHLCKAMFYEKVERCFKKIYSKFAILKRALKTMLLTGNMEAGFWAYQSNLNYRNVGIHQKRSVIETNP